VRFSQHFQIILFCLAVRPSFSFMKAPFLDLLASAKDLPSFEEIRTVVRKGIQPVAETLGLGQLDFRKYNESDDFIKCWVLTNEKPLFSIDLTRIGGSVLESQLVEQIIAGTDRTVRTATANYLLLQKCEVFLSRRVKARDAFDIYLLVARGASLNNNLKAHLEDFVLLKDLDSEFIESSNSKHRRKALCHGTPLCLATDCVRRTRYQTICAGPGLVAQAVFAMGRGELK